MTTNAIPTTRASRLITSGRTASRPVTGSALAGDTLDGVIVTIVTWLIDVGVVVGTVPAVVVVANVVVVDVVVHAGIEMYGATTRPRESPLPVNTALVSSWPPQSSPVTVSTTGPVEPAGTTPDVSPTIGLELMPTCQ